MSGVATNLSEDELVALLGPHSRLTVDEAVLLFQRNPVARGSRWLTYLVCRAVERSGYDRGHAVYADEAAALRAGEPRETVEGE